MTAKVRAAGGEIFAITSEPQSLANQAHDDWEIGFEHVGDPHHEISATCADRRWMSLFTSQCGETILGETAEWMSHPKGYFQPGILVLSRTGRVLYRWRCRPEWKNAGGALVRPTPTYVWSHVEAALGEPDDASDAAPDLNPEMDAPDVPWPLFVMLLIANGWFLRPRAFNHRAGQGSVQGRIRTALKRLIGFTTCWIAAEVFGPTSLVALAFAAWLAFAGIPGIRMVQAQFQQVDPNAEPA